MADTKVIPFPKQKGTAPESYWHCTCGSNFFALRSDMTIVCKSCNSTVSNLSLQFVS